ncbi:hypothetical protein CR513_33291, partial [Mucuna pruriens]
MGYAQPGYANELPPLGARDPPYGMPYGWRTKASTTEEHEQQNAVNNEGAKVVLNAVSGVGPSGDKYGLEAADLCLVLDVGLPTDFKTLEFNKYKGSSYPRVHLAMYYQKMATYIYDGKILVHCFQDSLTEAALSWYVSLERGRIKTWRDLAEAFLKQYKYNKDMALDHS